MAYSKLNDDKKGYDSLKDTVGFIPRLERQKALDKHASASFAAGQEITTPYDKTVDFIPRLERQKALDMTYSCDLCGSSPAEIRVSDMRRFMIRALCAFLHGTDPASPAGKTKTLAKGTWYHPEYSEDDVTITPVFSALRSVCKLMKKEILEDRHLTLESYYTGYNSDGERVERKHEETNDTSGTLCRYCTDDDNINITVAWTFGPYDIGDSGDGWSLQYALRIGVHRATTPSSGV
nr:hypothetical protein B0A51_11515 [Rachicladosporium sp. CCFEE 5018]